MSAAAGRGDETTPASDAGARWHEVDPEAGDPVVICPQCWPLVAASWRARLDVTVRTARAAAGVGTVRRVRSGGRVLMTGLEEGLPQATVWTAQRDGGVWQNGQATLV